MARTPENDQGGQSGAAGTGKAMIIQAEGQETIALPDAGFIKNAEILRDGQNLVLEAEDGSVIVIEGYFSADPAPLLQAPNGEALSPQLVESFVKQAGPLQFAAAGTENDASPVGAINEISGKATITRADGTTETLAIGMPVFEGDIIETEGDGAVNIVFIDETSFAISKNAKLAIDEYVFDPASESGKTDISILRGLFVFTSGLIGRDDPDDVNIDTPMGSIGIRGTVIAGNLYTGEVTVMEGAIVMRSFTGIELTLSNQYETATFNPATGEIFYEGVMSPAEFMANFAALQDVAQGLFSAVSSEFQSGETNNSGEPGTNDAESQQDGTGGTEAATDGATDNTSTDTSTDGTGETNTIGDDGAALEDPAGDTAAESVFADTTFGGNDAGFGEDGNSFGGDDSGVGGNDGGTLAGGDPTASGTAGFNGGTGGAGTTTGDSGNGNENTATGTDDGLPLPPPPDVINPPAPIPGAAITTTTLNVDENTGSGIAFGTVTTFGLIGSISFSEVGSTDFNINSSTGEITVESATLDYESGTIYYDYDIQATDSNDTTVTQTIRINLNNLDDTSSTLPVNTGLTLAEGANIALTTAMLEAIDEDTADSNITFTLNADPANGVSIRLNGTTLLDTDTFTMADVADGLVSIHHDGSEFEGIENINFSVGDGANPALTGQTFAVTVTAVNDAPTGTLAITGTAQENQTLTADTSGIADGDGLGTFSYQWTRDGSDITGATAATYTLDDADVGAVIAVRVSYTDGGGTLETLTSADTSLVTSDSTDIDTITGTAGNDILVGDDGNNIYIGLDGDDSITGGAGSDTIDGGAGIDTLNGGAGNDLFIATENDGSDTIDGGGGIDIYNASAVTSAINFDLFAGKITYNSIDDSVTNIEEFIGGSGDDIFISSSAMHTIDGDTGFDTVDYSASAAAVDVNLTTGTGAGGDAAGDTLINIENVIGTAFDDTITGNNAANTLTGGDGNDTIIGGAGADILNGGAGGDILFGGNDDDILVIDDNVDTADGGGGNDTLQFSAGGNFNISSTQIQSIEIIDATSSTDAQLIDIASDSSLLTQDLTIDLDDGDTLNIDFTGLGYALTVGSLNTAAGGSAVFNNGTNTITVTFDAGAAGRLTASGLTVPLNLNTIGGTDGFSITDNIGQGFGYSIAAIGDRNNDGFSDLAFGKRNNPNDDGRIFFLNGSVSQVDTTVPAIAAGAFTGLLNTPSIPDSPDFQSLASGGDFNGDGFIDFIVGAKNAHDDLINPGTGNVQIVSGQNGSILFELNGLGTSSLTGQSVAFAGDIDGDGLDDVIFNAPGDNAGEGAAYVIFGYDGGAVTNLRVGDLGNPRYLGSMGIFGADAVDVETTFTTVGEIAFIQKADNTIEMHNLTTGIAVGTISDTSVSSLTEYSVAGGGDAMTNGIADILVDGPYLYILTGNSGGGTNGQITILNISNPAVPAFVGLINNAGLKDATAMTISSDGRHLIAVIDNPTDGFIRRYDVGADGMLTANGGTTVDNSLNGAKDVVAHNGFAYVASDNFINVFDISGGTIPNAPSNFSLSGVTALHVDPVTGHLYAITNDSLKIFDIDANPSTLTPLDTLTNPELNGATDITVDQGMAYITTAAGVVSVDVSNPASPIFTGNINASAATGANDDSALAVTVAGDGTLLVASGGATDNLTSYDLSPPGFLIDGTGTQILGQNISSAGDFNNDGFEDFMISVPGADKVALVLGGEQNLRNFDIGTPATYIQISLPAAAAYTSIETISLGDINGDGIADIALAAETTSVNEINIFYGVDGATPNTNLTAGTDDDATIQAIAGYEIIAGSAAGDFNGDGFDDMVVAMRDMSGAGTAVSIYVIYGGILPTTIDGTYLNMIANAFKMSYTLTASTDEMTVTAAGDVNGDGFADLAFGFSGTDTDSVSLVQDGEAVVVYGREGGVESVRDGDVQDGNGTVNNLAATANLAHLVGRETAETISNGTFTGVTISAGAGDDTIVLGNNNFDRIDGGGGNDTLRLDLGGALDFTALGTEKFRGVENIDMTNAASQTVILGLDDIFDMMKNSPDNTARISGNGADIFVIEAPLLEGRTGVLFDNNPFTFQTGEGGLGEFGNITPNGGFGRLTSGGYHLDISNDLLTNGRVIIGQNIVLDNTPDDANPANNEIRANAANQTLVGSDNNTTFDDGSQNNVSMFGFNGDDTFTISNGNFDVINGGAGVDTISFSNSIDLRSFNNGEISKIETLELNNAAGVTLTLSKQNIADLLSTIQGGGTLTINSVYAADRLRIDNQALGGEEANTNDASLLAAALGGFYNGNSGGYETYTVAGKNVYIADTLFVNSSVDIL